MSPGLHFQSGGTLGEGAYYIERAADAELPEALKQGELCYLLTTRQIGKSSLRRRAAKRLQAEGVACVSIDLTSLGTSDVKVEDWYIGLASEIAQQLDLDSPDAFWEAHPGLGPVHCFSRYLEDELLARVTSPIVIFIDEIDATLSLPFSRDDFFAAVRAIYNGRADRPANRRLTFCLLGVAAPGDLIADPTRTPFNIGRGIRLEDFSREEINALRGGFEGIDADPDARLDEIHAWTSGHPYMTQRLCEDLTGERRGAPVDDVVRARFLERGRTEDANLQYAERCFGDLRAGGKGARAPKMLRLYRRLLEGEEVRADGGDAVQLALRLTGMAAERAGEELCLHVRSRIFAEVFDAAWVRAREADRMIAEPLFRWLDGGRREDLTLRGEALQEVYAWAETREDLTADERAFLNASARAEERAARRRLLTVMVGLLLLVTFGGGSFAYMRVSDAEREADRLRASAELARAKAGEAEAQAGKVEALAGKEDALARLKQAEDKARGVMSLYEMMKAAMVDKQTKGAQRKPAKPLPSGVLEQVENYLLEQQRSNEPVPESLSDIIPEVVMNSSLQAMAPDGGVAPPPSVAPDGGVASASGSLSGGPPPPSGSLPSGSLPSGSLPIGMIYGALRGAQDKVARCRADDGPRGRGKLAIEILPEGRVSSVLLERPFAGTKVGQCVEDAFRGIATKPFVGSPVTLLWSFTVP